MILPKVFLASSLAFTIIANPVSSCPPKEGPHGVQVRLPPWLCDETSWIAPPAGWYFKPWSMVYATNPQYFAFRNFQYDPTPLNPKRPAGQDNDLSSFQLPGNSTVYTSYGVDTPDPWYSAVLGYAGTGILQGATSTYALLAWGCDTSGVPYYASYSTAANASKTPAGIDIMSIDVKGPDAATVQAVIDGLKSLPDKEIQELGASLKKTTQDGGRGHLGRVTTCDEYCKSNQNLAAILG